MVLRIVSFNPAAWAIVPGSVRVLALGMVVLNLVIAVPVRAVRPAATLLLFAFVKNSGRTASKFRSRKRLFTLEASPFGPRSCFRAVTGRERCPGSFHNFRLA
jgi:hypothetical protein